MVKARPLAKSKVKAKLDGAAPTKKCRSTKKFDSSVPMCSGCGEFVDDDTKALQCERCESFEVWKCSKCLGLSDDLYEQLVTSSKSNLHWFCEKCEEDVLDPAVSNDKIISLLESLQMKSDSFQLQLLTNLAEMEQKMLEKVNSVEDQIFVKVESAVDEKLKKFEEKSVDKAYSVEQTFLRKVEDGLLEKIDGRLRKIEDSPAVIEGIQLRLEHKMDQLRNNMDQPVALAVQGAIQEDKAEELEIEHRKKNVIVHGVSESVAEEADERISDDLNVLAAMFHEVGVDNIQTESVVRLGKKASDPIQNPRPMKLVLNSEENKIRLLKNAKNLREKQEGGWSKVYIHQDLTPKQREARKPLLAELKERKAKGEKDLTIYRGKIVKKRSY